MGFHVTKEIGTFHPQARWGRDESKVSDRAKLFFVHATSGLDDLFPDRAKQRQQNHLSRLFEHLRKMAFAFCEALSARA